MNKCEGVASNKVHWRTETIKQKRWMNVAKLLNASSAAGLNARWGNNSLYQEVSATLKCFLTSVFMCRQRSETANLRLWTGERRWPKTVRHMVTLAWEMRMLMGGVMHGGTLIPSLCLKTHIYALFRVEKWPSEVGEATNPGCLRHW